MAEDLQPTKYELFVIVMRGAARSVLLTLSGVAFSLKLKFFSYFNGSHTTLWN